jgi:hypothetical protein
METQAKSIENCQVEENVGLGSRNLVMDAVKTTGGMDMINISQVGKV